MMNIVERLRDTTGIHEDLIYEAANEVKRLRDLDAPKDVEVIDGKVKAYDIGQNAIVNVRVKHDPTA